ncbi:sugar ABC transporter substrate-binding protein [Tissierella creatinophila]|uniref:Uncharacterized protein n=1 Tax=Tissierella creatinophila DSM 6911 TaxID=1123403 RepID=A0A1U7M6J3_TISCR|nr:ABC transporter substrate-binding protein [Tissierella creatinophila]OLS02927.1 hypothetical protein TICRE_10810 [Tissierella creatinophila DSM 6911]
MKKKLSLLLGLALMVTTLVACAPKETDDGAGDGKSQSGDLDKVKATISVQVEKDWRDYYEAAAERVKVEYPDSKIEFIETGSFDHLDVLDSTDVTNKDVADLFAIPADRIYGMSKNEALGSLDAKTMAKNLGGFDDYDNNIGGRFKIDDEYLAFPMNVETLVNFVNTKNAKANGIDLGKEIEFTELNNEDLLVPFFDAGLGVSFMNAANIKLLEKDEEGKFYSDMTKDFSELNATQQEVFKALFNYWKAHKEQGTPLFDKDAAWGYIDSSFETGSKTSIRLEGPWSTGNLSKLTGDGEDLDVLPLQQVVVMGNPISQWKGSWGLAINSRIEDDAQKKQLAEAMIQEIVNPEYAVDFFKATGKILDNVKADKYMDSDLTEMDKKVIKTVYDSYEKAPYSPLFTEWGKVSTTWENAVLSWNSINPATVEDAYKELQVSFQTMMDNL